MSDIDAQHKLIHTLWNLGLSEGEERWLRAWQKLEKKLHDRAAELILLRGDDEAVGLVEDRRVGRDGDNQ